jgi:hypothetical protein
MLIEINVSELNQYKKNNNVKIVYAIPLKSNILRIAAIMDMYRHVILLLFTLVTYSSLDSKMRL